MRRSTHDAGLWELVRRWLPGFIDVTRGGSDGGVVLAAASGGDIAGGEAVMVVAMTAG